MSHSEHGHEYFVCVVGPILSTSLFLSMTSRAGWAAQALVYCNNAGIIVISFKNFAEQHEREYVEQVRAGGPQAGANRAPPSSISQEFIQLTACSKNQLLPTALRWFVMKLLKYNYVCGCISIYC